uniref:Putative ovule protein n=1 Tax=Solanum chacoense TaxID=4108 RepID=A0A0V0H0C3_SOLCH
MIDLKEEYTVQTIGGWLRHHVHTSNVGLDKVGIVSYQSVPSLTNTLESYEELGREPCEYFEHYVISELILKTALED